MNKPPPLPDEFIDLMIGIEQNITDVNFESGYVLIEAWEEAQHVYINHFQKSGFSEKQSIRKAHNWFVESVAGSIGVTRSTMSTRENVCTLVPRTTKDLHPAVTFSHWKIMRRGESDNEKDNIERNLDWFYQEMDKRGGSPPSTRDLADYIKGKDKEPLWKRRLTKIISLITNFVEDQNSPDALVSFFEWVLEALEEADDN